MSVDDTPSEMAARTLLVKCGLPTRPELLLAAGEYRSRTKKARRVGVLLAFVAATLGIFLIPDQDSAGITVAQLFAGYLVGSVVAELLLGKVATSAVRTASLQRRTSSSFLPRWARVLPWLTLLPCIASPLLLAVEHPDTASTRDAYRPAALASDFSPTNLAAISITATAALGLTWFLTWRLTRRPFQVQDPLIAHLDVATRAMSARASACSASALGMALLAGMGHLAQVSYLRDLGFLLLLCSIGFFAVAQLPRLPERLGAPQGMDR